MKKITFHIILLLVLAMSVASCHSNEQNYKAAYDKAMEKHKDGIGAEAFAKIEAERLRPTTVINGDSVRMITMMVNVCDDNTAVGKPYNVIVGEFKQMFNAQNYRNRLKQEEGFPSYLLYDGRDNKYYVVIKGFDQKEVAAAFLKNIDKNVKIKILEPSPWILEKL